MCLCSILQSVGVSGLTGMGVDEFFTVVDQARLEYEQ